MSFFKQIISELDQSGLEYEIRLGARHRKIYIENKLSGILPRVHADSGTRAAKNVMAQIRRQIKQEKEKKIDTSITR